MTVWTPRNSVNTTWEEIVGNTSDLGAGLDEDLSRMTDEDGNVILFHNGEFFEVKTQWQIGG